MASIPILHNASTNKPIFLQQYAPIRCNNPGYTVSLFGNKVGNEHPVDVIDSAATNTELGMILADMAYDVTQNKSYYFELKITKVGNGSANVNGSSMFGLADLGLLHNSANTKAVGMTVNATEPQSFAMAAFDANLYTNTQSTATSSATESTELNLGDTVQVYIHASSNQIHFGINGEYSTLPTLSIDMNEMTTDFLCPAVTLRPGWEVELKCADEDLSYTPFIYHANLEPFKKYENTLKVKSYIISNPRADDRGTTHTFLSAWGMLDEQGAVFDYGTELSNTARVADFTNIKVKLSKSLDDIHTVGFTARDILSGGGGFDYWYNNRAPQANDVVQIDIKTPQILGGAYYLEALSGFHHNGGVGVTAIGTNGKFVHSKFVAGHKDDSATGGVFQYTGLGNDWFVNKQNGQNGKQRTIDAVNGVERQVNELDAGFPFDPTNPDYRADLQSDHFRSPVNLSNPWSSQYAVIEVMSPINNVSGSRAHYIAGLQIALAAWIAHTGPTGYLGQALISLTAAWNAADALYLADPILNPDPGPAPTTADVTPAVPDRDWLIANSHLFDLTLGSAYYRYDSTHHVNAAYWHGFDRAQPSIINEIKFFDKNGKSIPYKISYHDPASAATLANVDLVSPASMANFTTAKTDVWNVTNIQDDFAITDPANSTELGAGSSSRWWRDYRFVIDFEKDVEVHSVMYAVGDTRDTAPHPLHGMPSNVIIRRIVDNDWFVNGNPDPAFPGEFMDVVDYWLGKGNAGMWGHGNSIRNYDHNSFGENLMWHRSFNQEVVSELMRGNGEYYDRSHYGAGNRSYYLGGPDGDVHNSATVNEHFANAGTYYDGSVFEKNAELSYGPMKFELTTDSYVTLEFSTLPKHCPVIVTNLDTGDQIYSSYSSDILAYHAGGCFWNHDTPLIAGNYEIQMDTSYDFSTSTINGIHIYELNHPVFEENTEVKYNTRRLVHFKNDPNHATSIKELISGVDYFTGSKYDNDPHITDVDYKWRVGERPLNFQFDHTLLTDVQEWSMVVTVPPSVYDHSGVNTLRQLIRINDDFAIDIVGTGTTSFITASPDAAVSRTSIRFTGGSYTPPIPWTIDPAHDYQPGATEVTMTFTVKGENLKGYIGSRLIFSEYFNKEMLALGPQTTILYHSLAETYTNSLEMTDLIIFDKQLTETDLLLYRYGGSAATTLLDYETAKAPCLIADLTASGSLISGSTSAEDLVDFHTYTGLTFTDGDRISFRVVNGAPNITMSFLEGSTNLKPITIKLIDKINPTYDTWAPNYLTPPPPVLGSVRAATDTAIGDILAVYDEETGFTSAPLILDDITLEDADRVLVKDQTDAKQNGIYAVISAGVWTRVEDFDENTEIVVDSIVYVEEGTVNSGTDWQMAGLGSLLTLELNVNNIVWAPYTAPPPFANLLHYRSLSTYTYDPTSLTEGDSNTFTISFDVELVPSDYEIVFESTDGSAIQHTVKNICFTDSRLYKPTVPKSRRLAVSYNHPDSDMYIDVLRGHRQEMEARDGIMPDKYVFNDGTFGVDPNHWVTLDSSPLRKKALVNWTVSVRCNAWRTTNSSAVDSGLGTFARHNIIWANANQSDQDIFPSHLSMQGNGTLGYCQDILGQTYTLDANNTIHDALGSAEQFDGKVLLSIQYEDEIMRVYVNDQVVKEDYIPVSLGMAQSQYMTVGLVSLASTIDDNVRVQDITIYDWALNKSELLKTAKGVSASPTNVNDRYLMAVGRDASFSDGVTAPNELIKKRLYEVAKQDNAGVLLNAMGDDQGVNLYVNDLTFRSSKSMKSYLTLLLEKPTKIYYNQNDIKWIVLTDSIGNEIERLRPTQTRINERVQFNTVLQPGTVYQVKLVQGLTDRTDRSTDPKVLEWGFDFNVPGYNPEFYRDEAPADASIIPDTEIFGEWDPVVDGAPWDETLTLHGTQLLMPTAHKIQTGDLVERHIDSQFICTGFEMIRNGDGSGGSGGTGATTYSVDSKFSTHDYKVIGDGLITLDSATGLEWLRHTRTTTYGPLATVLALHPGFRLATREEVNEMFARMMPSHAQAIRGQAWAAGSSNYPVCGANIGAQLGFTDTNTAGVSNRVYAYHAHTTGTATDSALSGLRLLSSSINVYKDYSTYPTTDNRHYWLVSDGGVSIASKADSSFNDVATGDEQGRIEVTNHNLNDHDFGDWLPLTDGDHTVYHGLRFYPAATSFLEFDLTADAGIVLGSHTFSSPLALSNTTTGVSINLNLVSEQPYYLNLRKGSYRLTATNDTVINEFRVEDELRNVFYSFEPEPTLVWQLWNFNNNGVHHVNPNDGHLVDGITTDFAGASSLALGNTLEFTATHDCTVSTSATVYTSPLILTRLATNEEYEITYIDGTPSFVNLPKGDYRLEQRDVETALTELIVTSLNHRNFDFHTAPSSATLIKELRISNMTTTTLQNAPALAGLRIFDTAGNIFDGQFSQATAHLGIQYRSPSVSVDSSPGYTSDYNSGTSHGCGNIFNPATYGDNYSVLNATPDLFFMSNNQQPGFLTIKFAVPIDIAKIDYFDIASTDGGNSYGVTSTLKMEFIDDMGTSVYTIEEGPGRTVSTGLTPEESKNKVVYDHLQARFQDLQIGEIETIRFSEIHAASPGTYASFTGFRVWDAAGNKLPLRTNVTTDTRQLFESDDVRITSNSTYVNDDNYHVGYITYLQEDSDVVPAISSKQYWLPFTSETNPGGIGGEVTITLKTPTELSKLDFFDVGTPSRALTGSFKIELLNTSGQVKYTAQQGPPRDLVSGVNGDWTARVEYDNLYQPITGAPLVIPTLPENTIGGTRLIGIARNHLPYVARYHDFNNRPIDGNSAGAFDGVNLDNASFPYSLPSTVSSQYDSSSRWYSGFGLTNTTTTVECAFGAIFHDLWLFAGVEIYDAARVGEDVDSVRMQVTHDGVTWEDHEGEKLLGIIPGIRQVLFTTPIRAMGLRIVPVACGRGAGAGKYVIREADILAYDNVQELNPVWLDTNSVISNTDQGCTYAASSLASPSDDAAGAFDGWAGANHNWPYGSAKFGRGIYMGNQSTFPLPSWLEVAFPAPKDVYKARIYTINQNHSVKSVRYEVSSDGVNFTDVGREYYQDITPHYNDVMKDYCEHIFPQVIQGVTHIRLIVNEGWGTAFVRVDYMQYFEAVVNPNPPAVEPPPSTSGHIIREGTGLHVCDNSARTLMVVSVHRYQEPGDYPVTWHGDDLPNWYTPVNLVVDTLHKTPAEYNMRDAYKMDLITAWPLNIPLAKHSAIPDTRRHKDLTIQDIPSAFYNYPVMDKHSAIPADALQYTTPANDIYNMFEMYTPPLIVPVQPYNPIVDYQAAYKRGLHKDAVMSFTFDDVDYNARVVDIHKEFAPDDALKAVIKMEFMPANTLIPYTIDTQESVEPAVLVHNDVSMFDIPAITYEIALEKHDFDPFTVRLRYTMDILDITVLTPFGVNRLVTNNIVMNLADDAKMEFDTIETMGVDSHDAFPDVFISDVDTFATLYDIDTTPRLAATLVGTANTMTLPIVFADKTPDHTHHIDANMIMLPGYEFPEVVGDFAYKCFETEVAIGDRLFDREVNRQLELDPTNPAFEVEQPHPCYYRG